jgi:hypothetical protein
LITSKASTIFAVIGLTSLTLLPPSLAEVSKRVDRFNDAAFWTSYTANPGECSRLNNKSASKDYQLSCVIVATTFKHSYDRSVGIAFVDSVQGSESLGRGFSGGNERVYLLFTMRDGTKKRSTIAAKDVKFVTWKNGAAKGTRAISVAAWELNDSVANNLASASFVEFRYLDQEYIWRLSQADVKKLLELSEPPPRPW